MVRVVHLIIAVRGVRVGVTGRSLLVAHGILVDGCVGLRSGVERGWDAIAGLTAVVTVPIIHSTVRVIV